MWQEHDAVFAGPDGRSAGPRADRQEFKDLQEEVGITNSRLHDGSRHTAGTTLNELGGRSTVMEILGTLRSARPSGSRAGRRSRRTPWAYGRGVHACTGTRVWDQT